MFLFRLYVVNLNKLPIHVTDYKVPICELVLFCIQRCCLEKRWYKLTCQWRSLYSTSDTSLHKCLFSWKNLGIQ